jgi:hypothetical protein
MKVTANSRYVYCMGGIFEWNVGLSSPKLVLVVLAPCDHLQAEIAAVAAALIVEGRVRP